MKAIIIKNNEFKTIGFEVIANGEKVFTWGVSTLLKTNYQKEIDVREHINAIFRLVELRGRLVALNGYASDFFEALNSATDKDGNKVKHREGIAYTLPDKEKKEELINETLDIINNIE